MSSFVLNENLSNKLEPYDCNPFSLVVGVICGSIIQIKPLLEDIYNLRELRFITNIEVVILANGESYTEVSKLLLDIFIEPIAPVFSIIGGESTESILPIGQARSKLQKVVGSRMEKSSSFAWILDDDMRIPKEAEIYLTWLPAFKAKGTDVIIGNFNGSSPNPPAHGIRVQLNDFIHNLNWLNNLPDYSDLQDKSYENQLFRLEYPDYYYDLSRKHKEHLNKPYWITPKYKGETVGNARQRMIDGLGRILTGEPFLRPLITSLESNPLNNSVPSCNRGGNTFILNSKALTLTPNTVLLTNGEENRRSDMIWAVINRYYHNLKIHAVSFPVYHHRYVNISKDFSLDKTTSEIRGSALYAAMLSFLQERPQVHWDELISSSKKVSNLYYSYIETRLAIYKVNFEVINTLLDRIECEFKEISDSNQELLNVLRKWVSSDNLSKISAMVNISNETVDVEGFLQSINNQIDSFK